MVRVYQQSDQLNSKDIWLLELNKQALENKARKDLEKMQRLNAVLPAGLYMESTSEIERSGKEFGVRRRQYHDIIQLEHTQPTAPQTIVTHAVNSNFINDESIHNIMHDHVIQSYDTKSLHVPHPPINKQNNGSNRVNFSGAVKTHDPVYNRQKFSLNEIPKTELMVKEERDRQWRECLKLQIQEKHNREQIEKEKERRMDLKEFQNQNGFHAPQNNLMHQNNQSNVMHQNNQNNVMHQNNTTHQNNQNNIMHQNNQNNVMHQNNLMHQNNQNNQNNGMHQNIQNNQFDNLNQQQEQFRKVKVSMDKSCKSRLPKLKHQENNKITRDSSSIDFQQFQKNYMNIPTNPGMNQTKINSKEKDYRNIVPIQKPVSRIQIKPVQKFKLRKTPPTPPKMGLREWPAGVVAARILKLPDIQKRDVHLEKRDQGNYKKEFQDVKIQDNVMRNEKVKISCNNPHKHMKSPIPPTIKQNERELSSETLERKAAMEQLQAVWSDFLSQNQQE